MEKRIYEKLRSHKSTRKHNSKSEDSTFRQERRSKVQGEHLERLTDFSVEEVKTMLLDEEVAKKFYGIIGAGKEANVYWIKDFDNRYIALKMFRINTTSHNFRSLHRFDHLPDTAKLGIASNLCLKEYENLNTMYDAGVTLPKPIQRYEFTYSMEFLGTKRGPAPLLRNVNLVDEGVKPIEVLDHILEELDIMFNKSQMVHGDFSEHNIIWFNETPYIIDVLQSQQYHPRYATPLRIRKREALKILKRDIYAILDHFRTKYRISYDPEFVFHTMVEEEVDDWIPDELMSEACNLDSYIQDQKRVRLI